MKTIDRIFNIINGVKKVGVTAMAVAGPAAVYAGMQSDVQWLRVAGLFASAIPYGLALRPLADAAVSTPEENNPLSSNGRERDYAAIEQELNSLTYKH